MVLENFNLYLEKYAELIVAVGVNVQKSHTVVLNIAVDQVELAHLITKKAYEHGAAEAEFLRSYSDRITLLAQTAVNFWDLTWNDSRRHLPYETRLLLSLANAVGAGRMRQATRELVKAYIHGLDSAALDDVFELLAWNQGIGYFSSEIGPSTLFQAYKTIKQMEKKGNTREEIAEVLKEKFGEKHPDVKVV